MASFDLMAASFGLEMEKIAKQKDEPFYKRHKGKLLAGAGIAAALGTGAYLHHKGHITFKRIPKATPAPQAPLATASRPPVRPQTPKSPKPPKPKKPFRVIDAAEAAKATPEEHRRLIPHAPRFTRRIPDSEVEETIDRAFMGPHRTALQQRLYDAQKPPAALPPIRVRKKGKTASAFLHEVLAQLFEI